MIPYFLILANIAVNIHTIVNNSRCHLVIDKFYSIGPKRLLPHKIVNTLLLLLFFHIPSIAQFPVVHGTSIFGLATAETVIIGADSRYRTSDDGVLSKSDTTCKIFKERSDIVFAIAGNPILGFFDMISVGKLACKEGKTFEDVTRLCRVITSHVIGEYIRISKSTPESRIRYQKDILGKAGVEFYFVGRTTKKLSVYSFRYVIRPNGNKDTTFQEVGMTDLPLVGEIPIPIFGGYVEHSMPYTEQIQPRLISGFTKEKIIEVIEQEIAPHREEVGKPIDVFLITKKNITRLTTDRKCKPIK